VPICNALPSRIIASTVRVLVAAGEALLAGSCRPTEHRHGQVLLHEVGVHVEHAMRTSSRASSCVAWAVWPSCHRNSLVRRNIRVRISQRITLAHWLMSSGRSRWLWIHLWKKWPMMVSLVGG
jgi:hypothetical protein